MADAIVAGPRTKVEIPINSGAELAGRIVQTKIAASCYRDAKVELASTSFSGLPVRSSPVAADGSFMIKDLSPGTYEPSVRGLKGCAVRGVLLDGKPAQSIDLRQRAAISIQTEEALARIEGTAPAAVGGECRCTALLVPVDARGEVTGNRARFAAIVGDGAYRFEGLLPGSYLLIVLPLSDAVHYASKGFWSGNRGRAAAITLGASETARLTSPLTRAAPEWQ